MIAKGTFEITMQAEPPFEDIEGVKLARATFDKRFSGPLEATSHVTMLSARTPVPDSAGYVALERIQGTVEGRSGTFVVAHLGMMSGGGESLVIHVVPDSGTGELTGISGEMQIAIVEGQHFYTLDYAFS